MAKPSTPLALCRTTHLQAAWALDDALGMSPPFPPGWERFKAALTELRDAAYEVGEQPSRPFRFHSLG